MGAPCWKVGGCQSLVVTAVFYELGESGIGGGVWLW